MDTVIPVDGGSPAAAPSAAPASHRPAPRAATAERLAAWLRCFGFTDPAAQARIVCRVLADPALPADDPAAALAHAERRAAAWFAAVLGEELVPPGRAGSIGRAAFLLADAAQRWPESFLCAGQPPAALIAALRRAVPYAVPEPLPSAMPYQSLAWIKPAELVRLLFPQPELNALKRLDLRPRPVSA